MLAVWLHSDTSIHSSSKAAVVPLASLHKGTLACKIIEYDEHTDSCSYSPTCIFHCSFGSFAASRLCLSDRWSHLMGRCKCLNFINKERNAETHFHLQFSCGILSKGSVPKAKPSVWFSCSRASLVYALENNVHSGNVELLISSVEFRSLIPAII